MSAHTTPEKTSEPTFRLQIKLEPNAQHVYRSCKWIAILVLNCLVSSMPVFLEAQERESDLAVARQCATWLDSVSKIESGKRFWPTAPGSSNAAARNLYSGTPGVVLFYLELHAATAEQQFLQTAIEGGDWLLEHALNFESKPDPAFFTGIAGVGFMFDHLYHASKLPRFKRAGQRCYDYLISSRKESDEDGIKTVCWNDVTDIIGGTAGIGYYLLGSRRYDNRNQALKLAINAGDHLLSKSQQVELPNDEIGLKWQMSPTFPREMPNYSHGTAGICDFLLALDQACREQTNSSARYDGRFLNTAIQGARYLEMLAIQSDATHLIPHHFPGGEKLFYLGWCHGPSGTVRFFKRLSKQTQNKRWGDLANEMTRSLCQTGIPKARTEGFWNNAGLCCGDSGVASFLLDHAETANAKQTLKLIDALTLDIVQRATRQRLANGEVALSWTHAEHRVQPKLLQAQTGLMQGNAGIGMYFIRRHQKSHGKKLVSDMPLMPY